MGALLLFGIIFFGRACIILADGGEKNNTGIDMIEDPLPTADGYTTESFDYGDDYNDTDDYDEANSRSIKTHLLKKHIRDDEKKFKVIRVTRKPLKELKFLKESIEEMKRKEEERRKIKLVFKIIAGVVVLFACGGISACTRHLCKKNRRSVPLNPEETVPSLSTEPNTATPLPYPQQPSVYPLQQISNPYAASFQQNSPAYPTNPTAYPTNPTSYSPAPNVPEKVINHTTASNPGQPFLYPPQPGIYPLQQVSNPPTTPLQQNALPYPTEPISHSPSQNVPEKETNRL